MVRQMSLEKPIIVLFDMDGTIVRHVHPKLLAVLERLDDCCYKLSKLFSRNKKIEDLSEEPSKNKRLLVHRALHKFRRKPVEQIVEPCPGIFSLLNLLKEENISLGVVSNGLGKGYGHDILEKFNLESYFDIKIFREDIQKSKPHPDPIIRALRAIKEDFLETDIVWYIGDHHKDIMAALAADTNFCPVKLYLFLMGLMQRWQSFKIMWERITSFLIILIFLTV